MSSCRAKRVAVIGLYIEPNGPTGHVCTVKTWAWGVWLIRYPAGCRTTAFSTNTLRPHSPCYLTPLATAAEQPESCIQGNYMSFCTRLSERQKLPGQKGWGKLISLFCFVLSCCINSPGVQCAYICALPLQCNKRCAVCLTYIVT